METNKPEPGDAKPGATQPETQKMLEQDNQLRRALDLLKGYKIMGQVNVN